MALHAVSPLDDELTCAVLKRVSLCLVEDGFLCRLRSQQIGPLYSLACSAVPGQLVKNR
jgi:hypothetical protein